MHEHFRPANINLFLKCCSCNIYERHTVAAKRLQVVEESPLGGRVLYFGRFCYHHHVLRADLLSLYSDLDKSGHVCAFLLLCDKLQCCNCFVNLIAV
jgi:hypothetical protein